jgi:(E)-4-hydroxy-3-methyl-but-2-enyl pyrophosphate reductase
MITIITDTGYCYGVKQALKILKKASREHPNVVLVHPLIHNLTENALLLKEAKATLYDPKNPAKPGAVVFSAHGYTLEEAEAFKGICPSYDATCPLILARYQALARLDPSVSVVFLGKKGHQETLGFLSHFPSLLFVDENQDLAKQITKLPLKEKIGFVPQTTLSEEKALTCLSLLEKRGQVVYSLGICPHYQQRTHQALAALAKADPEKSFFLVCGDKASSNANEILNAVLKTYPGLTGTIAMSVQEINPSLIQGKDIYVSSATSSSEEAVQALVASLRSLPSLS